MSPGPLCSSVDDRLPAISMRLVLHQGSAGARRTLQALTAVPQVATYASQRVPHHIDLCSSLGLLNAWTVDGLET